MDPVRNPFAPGAGNPPPELAGREDILRRAEIVIDRSMQQRHAKSFMLVGLRGVGKTVLLNRIKQVAVKRGARSQLIESPEEKPLPELLVPALRRLLLGLDTRTAAGEGVRRGLGVLAKFARSLKVHYEGLEIGLEPELGTADSGDLDNDLTDLLLAVGQAAKSMQTAAVLLIDELQYVREAELDALVMAVHRTSQEQLPVVLVGAGLPQLVGQLGRSKSYAERLFDFTEVGPLARADAISAITAPIAGEGESIAKTAVERIVKRASGYPFFLQVWGYHCWNQADQSPIALSEVEKAEAIVTRELDEGFFRVRFDRLAPAEKRYLRAMAALGPGPHRSEDVAEVLKVKLQSVAPVRSSLIKKGMVYSPQPGDTAFTVPFFDAYLKRQLPSLGPAL